MRGVKLKITLINPRLRAWSPNIWVSLGLTYIAAVLEEEGHTIKIIDLNEKRLNDGDLKAELEKDVDVVGITGMITEYQKILTIADIAKDGFSDRSVIIGGPIATTIPQELLKQSQADFIVMGEGEKTTPALVHAIEYGSDIAEIRGIAYKKGEQVIINEHAIPISNIDTIPFPARHLLDMGKYLKNHFEIYGFDIEGYGKIRSTNLISSRGCPYDCTFCFKDMWGYKWRGRSAENIIAEMELLNEKYNVNGFFFNDDTFVLDKKRVFEFTSLLKKSGLDVVWSCNGRVNLMQMDMLKAMRGAGCVSIAYGIESGNQSILDSMKKNITLNQTKNAVKWTKESGIKAAGCFMIGMLGEAKETIIDTINFAKELDLDFYGFSITTPLPGTELYRKAMISGLIPPDGTSLKSWDFDVNVNLTKDCTDEDLRRFKYEAFKEFTLKKQFGKYYMINPIFISNSLKVVLGLRNKTEAKNFMKNVGGIVKSYLNTPKTGNGGG